MISRCQRYGTFVAFLSTGISGSRETFQELLHLLCSSSNVSCLLDIINYVRLQDALVDHDLERMKGSVNNRPPVLWAYRGNNPRGMLDREKSLLLKKCYRRNTRPMFDGLQTSLKHVNVKFIHNNEFD